MAGPRVPPPPPLPGESATPQVLIVDDDPDARDVLTQMLHVCVGGIAVEACGSAGAALEHVRATDYAAIICDVRLPDIDGIRLLGLIHELRPDTPVILVTAYGDEMAVQALRAGAYDFIQKPINSDYLAASLTRALQMRKLSRRVAAQNAALARHASELEATVEARTRELLAANQAKNVFLAERDRALAEAEAASRRLAFLAEASRVLGGSLDYPTTLEKVAALAVPYLADCCVFVMLQDDERLVPVAQAYVDQAPPLPAGADELRSHHAGRGYAALAGVLRAGRSALYTEVSDAMLANAAADDSDLQLFRAVAPRSCMLVPLVARGRTLGVLILLTTVSGRRYGAADLALAEDLAGRAALAVDNARLYREAQEALQARDQFLSVAAHELRTPITAMLASVQLLQRRAAGETMAPARDLRAINILGEQARRLHRLILSLLDISRLQTGQFAIERAPVDVVALARRVVEELQPLLQDHPLSFSGPGGPLIVEGDDLLLEQVLQNLLQNAIKYSPAGQPITVVCARREQTVCLDVIDRGIGIPAAALPRLFSRFYRAENVDSRQVSGMGLGLYVVREIVALHGGTVDVTSTQGQGSTFTVCLPLHTP